MDFCNCQDIVIVGESGNPIHSVEVFREDGVFCEEVLILTCTGMKDILELNPLSMALKEPDGEIIPLNKLIKPGSIVQLTSIKGDDQKLRQREMVVTELVINEEKEEAKIANSKMEEGKLTMRATYLNETVDVKFQPSKSNKVHKLLSAFCHVFHLKYSKCHFSPLNEEANNVLKCGQPVDGAEFQITLRQSAVLPISIYFESWIYDVNDIDLEDPRIAYVIKNGKTSNIQLNVNKDGLSGDKIVDLLKDILGFKSLVLRHRGKTMNYNKIFGPGSKLTVSHVEK